MGSLGSGKEHTGPPERSILSPRWPLNDVAPPLIKQALGAKLQAKKRGCLKSAAPVTQCLPVCSDIASKQSLSALAPLQPEKPNPKEPNGIAKECA